MGSEVFFVLVIPSIGRAGIVVEVFVLIVEEVVVFLFDSSALFGTFLVIVKAVIFVKVLIIVIILVTLVPQHVRAKAADVRRRGVALAAARCQQDARALCDERT